MGRFRSRNVRRVVNNNKDRDNSSYTGIASDDEDDADWNSGDKRSRKKKERNGAKKGKGIGLTVRSCSKHILIMNFCY